MNEQEAWLKANADNLFTCPHYGTASKISIRTCELRKQGKISKFTTFVQDPTITELWRCHECPGPIRDGEPANLTIRHHTNSACLCKDCGTTDPTKFFNNGRSLCAKCRSRRHRAKVAKTRPASRMVKVKCPVCGKSREIVDRPRVKSANYLVRCLKCSQKGVVRWREK